MTLKTIQELMGNWKIPTGYSKGNLDFFKRYYTKDCVFAFLDVSICKIFFVHSKRGITKSFIAFHPELFFHGSDYHLTTTSLSFAYEMVLSHRKVSTIYDTFLWSNLERELLAEKL